MECLAHVFRECGCHAVGLPETAKLTLRHGVASPKSDDGNAIGREGQIRGTFCVTGAVPTLNKRKRRAQHQGRNVC